jgi:hypothetical protein
LAVGFTIYGSVALFFVLRTQRGGSEDASRSSDPQQGPSIAA